MRSAEVATEAGVNVQTLRYYERRGLLAAPARLPSGYRRCREAHCIVTGTGWAVVAVLIAIELAVGRSFVLGSEGLVFLAILIVGVGFEVLWRLRHGTNVLVRAH
jgi:hypothetical protein